MNNETRTHPRAKARSIRTYGVRDCRSRSEVRGIEPDFYNKYALLVIAAVVFLAGCAAPQPATKLSYEPLITGTVDQGDVAIELAPRWEGTLLVVDLGANTHSVDLSQFDLSRQAVLNLGGRKIAPQNPPRLSGHHVSSSLVFNAGATSDQFEIAITGIPAEIGRAHV